MSIGAGVTAIGIIAIVGFLLIVLGVGMDKVYDKNNVMIESDNAYSTGRLAAMTAMFDLWYVFGAIVVFLVLFWAVKQANIDSNTEI